MARVKTNPLGRKPKTQKKRLRPGRVAKSPKGLIRPPEDAGKPVVHRRTEKLKKRLNISKHDFISGQIKKRNKTEAPCYEKKATALWLEKYKDSSPELVSLA